MFEALLSEGIVSCHDGHGLRAGAVGRRQPVGAGGSEDVHAVVLDQTQLPEARPDLGHQGLILVEAHELIGAELEVRPLLVNLLLLAIDDLLDLLRLLVGLEQLPRPKGLCVAKLLGAGQDDVEDGRDLFVRPVDQLVNSMGIPPGNGLAVHLRGPGHLETERGRMGDLGLQNRSFEVRHDGSCGKLQSFGWARKALLYGNMSRSIGSSKRIFVVWRGTVQYERFGEVCRGRWRGVGVRLPYITNRGQAKKKRNGWGAGVLMVDAGEAAGRRGIGCRKAQTTGPLKGGVRRKSAFGRRGRDIPSQQEKGAGRLINSTQCKWNMANLYCADCEIAPSCTLFEAPSPNSDTRTEEKVRHIPTTRPLFLQG